MEWVYLLAGLVAGFAAGVGFKAASARKSEDMVQRLVKESEDRHRAEMNIMVEMMKSSFGSLSLEALSKSTGELLKLAESKLATERAMGARELEGKKELIDKQVERMANELENITKLVQELEKDRAEKFGELASQLKSTGEQTILLTQTAGALRETLANVRARGQWGERMAEDILRVAGFKENINYLKQKTQQGVGTRPDFTFLLPNDLKLNMDVKFPLENYIRFMESVISDEKDRLKNNFLHDVKDKIKEVTGRDYIDPGQGTVDYVLLFIPNEQIYSFIHEHDSTLLDEGFKLKVVLCSPMTLFALLAVIRHTTDKFMLAQASNEVLSAFGGFKKQWLEFMKKFDAMGKRIADLEKEYGALMGVRKKKLETQLDRIDSLREQRGLAVVTIEDESQETLNEDENA